MKDGREQGVSYGYVVIPAGGLTVDGVRFPEGPRAAGKKGWHRLLLLAGCEEIEQSEYEAFLKESQDSHRKEIKDELSPAPREKKKKSIRV